MGYEVDPDEARTWLPTMSYGSAQVSLMETEDGVYLINFITRKDARGKGHAAALWERVLLSADLQGVVLLTHPDDDRMLAGCLKHGWEIWPDREWEGKPLLVREPK